MSSATKAEYDKHLAEIQKNVDTFPFKVFGPLVEVCLNDLDIPYQKAFPQADTMCVYSTKVDDHLVYIMVDGENMELVFDIQQCPLNITMPLFAYEEVFEPSTFAKKYELVKRVIAAGLAG